MKKVFICTVHEKYNGLACGELTPVTKFVFEKGYFPVSTVRWFSDFIPFEKQADPATVEQMELEIIKDCDEFWVFGDELTPKMEQQIRFANVVNYRAPRYFNSKLEETDGFKGKKKLRGLFG